ncbi:hypothetical protein EHS39_32920 [Ensifer sp. MPMI2T]|nr:hypothetical protein EHS39_32920 [Ensifer sp. MPMI2T]
MKVRVIDFETTGQAEDKKKGKPVGICEVGWTDFTDDGKVSLPQAHLVNPGMPIPPEARAVHHISDEMVADAMSPSEAYMLLMAGMEPGDMFAAHQAEFERTFFGGGAHAWLCTMKCAKHLWDDVASYSNQALRYHLGIDVEFEWPELAMPPHRAGPDSYVTAHILSRLSIAAHPTRLVELTNTPVLQKKVMFGEKHRGQLWSDMDRGFLEWVLDKDFDAETKHTARHWLNEIRRQSNPFGN